VFNPLDTSGVDAYDDPPPPFKEFESPVHPRGANFGAGVDDGKGPGEQIAEGSKSGGAKGGAEAEGLEDVAIGEGAIIDQNIGDVDDVSGQDSSEGTKGNNGTSQDAGDHTRGANSPIREEGAREKGKDSQEQEKSEQEREGNRGAVDDSQATGEDANLTSGDTQGGGDDTQDTGMYFRYSNLNQAKAFPPDSAPKPEPTFLTPDQREAETHRNAFLLKEAARLEESRAREKLDTPDDQGPSETQARLSAVKERMTRIIFAGAFMFHRSYTVLPQLMFVTNKDPPRCPPGAFEVPSAGQSALEFTSALTNTIVDLLLERQDAGPIKVKVPYTKNKQKNMEKLLKEFNAE
jgi:hypothetical protein